MAHGDYTGQVKQRLAHQFAEQQRLAATSMSMVQDTVREGRDQVIDLFNDKDYENLALAQQEHEIDGVVQVGDPGALQLYKAVTFRASEDLEDVTVGQDRHFSLKGGQVYQAPRWVVVHLDDKGLVWH